MTPALSVHQRWRELKLASAPQILTCVHCVLEQWEHDDLAAPFWRWYWNDRPGAWVVLPRERVEIEPGKVYLIPPHTVFGTGCVGPVGHFYVHFTLGLDRAATPGRIFSHRASRTERTLIEAVLAAARSEADAAPTVTFQVQTLVGLALSDIPDDYWAGRLMDGRIARALDGLALGAAGGDNSELARRAGMNTNAFIRKFVQATGQSPHQYRLRLRVERAAAWLREGRKSIEDIAVETGFCDRFHFSRVFTRIIGTTPARYRASMRNQD